ncbi:anti-sigma factor family protein [Nocardia concava]|uniref:anti-sigma factor family protein n=1 Tax=Nocardia concava TaxID=257281 RepID=UPI0002FEA709|nr:zf-HC2 domain-containing protein [Nocardia concava]
MLGGLDPADRAAVDAHAAVCPECRRELAEFAVVPGLLAKTEAPQADTAAPEAPSAALRATLRAVADERAGQRRRRFAATAGLTAAALVAGIALGFVLHPGDSPALPGVDRVIALTSSSGTSGGTIDLTPKPWGTELHLTLRDLPTGQRLTALVVGVDGQTESAATWTTPAVNPITVTGAVSFRADTVHRIEIRTDSGTPVAVATG